MLNSQLIDILNSDDAWAFIGSGCSIDAGLPSWQVLLSRSLLDAESSIATLPDVERERLIALQQKQRFPEAFSILKSYYGSDKMDSIVCRITDTDDRPGEATQLVARWPFASYITTNYDHLLEKSLASFGGWVSVGNTSDENAKISGDVRQVVWHPHGGARLGTKNSRLVLASTDYDEIYPAGSPTLAALEAVCRMKRIVFIGFGFRDPDLIATLQKISRLVTPARPAFGFLANCGRKDRDEYWERYKIEIIPYEAHEADHSDLLKVMSAYGAFVLERSFRFGNSVATPDYDIETVGLLTHNRLVRAGWAPSSDSLHCIIRGFVLAHLKIRPAMTIDEIVNAMPYRTARNSESVRQITEALIAEGSIVQNNDRVSLSDKGSMIAQKGKADYELRRDQFYLSVEARATEHCGVANNVLMSNVRDITVSYLEQMSQERGLGVAQQLVESGDVENRARSVALLQGVQSSLSAARTRDAAFLAVRCITEILSAPRAEEKNYLGLRTQAYFGKQLLGTDMATIGIQLTNLSSAVFIADSSFMIPLLAEGSVGNQYASTLFQKLTSSQCPIVTSDLLLHECVEHAQWAWNLLNKYGGASVTALDAARCARGYLPNAFLSGYLKHPGFGPGESFNRYFAAVFDSHGEMPVPAMVTECLRKRGIILQKLSEWQGFDEVLWNEMEQVQQEIERRRRKNRTYTREHQVKAEAEVAIIVSQVRRRKFAFAGHHTTDAYFLSHSRVVDNLPGQAHRVCMTPESLLGWILSVGEISESDANAIYDQLLWEMSRDGVDIVPRSELLRLFHNTIDASRHKLEEVLSEHRELIRERYAVPPDKAFLDIDPLSIPDVANEVSRDMLNAIQERAEQERRLRIQAETKAKAAIKDEKEFSRLKAEKKQRQEKAKRKQRAAQSSPSKKKKGKKKKK